ncbi:efflux RND transporter periplasmic adaptor subunit [Ferrimonas sp. SCSIO 43195]|uniref:efflux RND transporter periplasmic adaptor subunit n=1 Tax=Ferrimonas sp. SCSIO 43195 TaxID=2822844 RepID=UPI00207576AE|nr:efflux RND transporter periplasmic adaptor subunit [Ferrimonas sp. SCSIO 43195]
MNKITPPARRWYRHPYVIASTISVLLVLWVASGQFGNAAEEAPLTEDTATSEVPVTRVTVKRITSSEVTREVQLYGRTEPDRMTRIAAEIGGRVLKVHAKRGAKVSQGQLLIELDARDLPEQLQSAEAVLAQRELDYQAASKLANQGLQGKSQLAQNLSALELARAELKRLQLALDHTQIRAPFSGVFHQRMVEQGDYVGVGDPVGELADLDPLVVKANVTESDIAQLSLGQAARARFVDGRTAQGTVRYIATVSHGGTNTFDIEVAFDNADGSLWAGKSAELSLPLDSHYAIKVSPALLALDEAGNLGVKSVEDGLVKFIPIEVVMADAEGVWTGGVGKQVEIITQGQGFVRDGDPVEVVYDQGDGA